MCFRVRYSAISVRGFESRIPSQAPRADDVENARGRQVVPHPKCCHDSHAPRTAALLWRGMMRGPGRNHFLRMVFRRGSEYGPKKPNVPGDCAPLEYRPRIADGVVRESHIHHKSRGLALYFEPAEDPGKWPRPSFKKSRLPRRRRARGDRNRGKRVDDTLLGPARSHPHAREPSDSECDTLKCVRASEIPLRTRAISFGE